MAFAEQELGGPASRSGSHRTAPLARPIRVASMAQSSLKTQSLIAYTVFGEVGRSSRRVAPRRIFYPCRCLARAFGTDAAGRMTEGYLQVADRTGSIPDAPPCHPQPPPPPHASAAARRPRRPYPRGRSSRRAPFPLSNPLPAAAVGRRRRVLALNAGGPGSTPGVFTSVGRADASRLSHRGCRTVASQRPRWISAG